MFSEPRRKLLLDERKLYLPFRDAGSTFLVENMSVFLLFVSVKKGTLGLDQCVELKFINRRIPGDMILCRRGKKGENRSVGG